MDYIERKEKIHATKLLVLAELARIEELLTDEKFESFYCSVHSELKNKMHELRRDTLRLEKLIYRR